MLQIFFLFLVSIAFGTSILTVGFGFYVESRPDIQHSIDIVGGLAAATLWFLSAFGATSIERVSNGIVSTVPATGLAFVFAAFGVLMVGIALMGTTLLFNIQDIAQGNEI